MVDKPVPVVVTVKDTPPAELTIPSLARDAQALKVWTDKGRISAPLRAGVKSWQYSYELSLFLTDFAEDPDLVFAAVLDWLAANQPELLLDPSPTKEPIVWEAEILDDNKVDLLITIELTESVQGQAVPGGFDMVHLPAPMLDDDLPIGASVGRF